MTSLFYIVVGSAWLGVGKDIGAIIETIGRGTSPDLGINAIGRSKRAKVINSNWLVMMPVYIDAYVGSRENTYTGSMMSGSYGGPIVVIIVPSVDVFVPKP